MKLGDGRARCRRQHRQCIARGRAVRNITCECATVLDLYTADLATRCSKHRETILHLRRRDDLAVRRQTAEPQHIVHYFDAHQLGQAPQIDERLRAQCIEIQADIYIRTARDRHERRRLCIQ